MTLICVLAGLLMAAGAGCRPDATMERIAFVEDLPFPAIVGDTPVAPLPVPASDNVGSVAGRASVQGGAAAYSIPIQIPPGRRGVQPDVALTYSSRGESGALGVGWSLSAGSSIYRCPHTVAQDGQTRGVELSSSDRLCLDGQRLVRVRGEYGRMGSEYRTEVDRFARVTLFQDTSSYASYFRVETKAGLVHWYGAVGSMNAVYLPPGATVPLAWKLRRTLDAQQNSIEYTYAPSEAGHVLSEIRFAGSGTERGDRRVVFDYAPGRPDVGHAYRAGALLVSPLRLTAIRTYADNELVRRYELGYRGSAATGRSLLTRLRVCGNAACTGPDTTPWTEFAYSEGTIDVVNTPLMESGAQNRQVRLVGDYDGDGTRDRLVLEYPRPWGGVPSRRLLQLSSRAGEAIDLTAGPWFAGFDNPVTGHPTAPDTDFDRDGTADLVGVSQGRLVFASWRGDRLVQTGSDLLVEDSAYLIDARDMDADGDTDVLIRQSGALRLHQNCTPRGSASLRFCGSAPVTTMDREEVTRVVDLDGNGLPDLVIDWNGYGDPTSTRLVFTGHGSAGLRFTEAMATERGGPLGSLKAVKGTGFFDANGDGLLDIYRLPDGLWLNDGGRFVASSPGTIALRRKLYDTVFALDIDGDGRDEIFVPDTLVHQWCQLDADQFEPFEYCGEEFYRNGAPEHLDRSIYRWDAVRVRFTASGAARFERAATTLTAPVRATRPEDFFGDGLADLHYRVIDAYGDMGAGTVVIGGYRPPLARGGLRATNP
jgi:hypothetical protein